MSLISILAGPIKKSPWLMSKAYDVYDFMFPKYLSVIKHFSGKYALERNVNKLKKSIKKKGGVDIYFENGEPRIFFKNKKFTFMPDSQGFYFSTFRDAEEIMVDKIILENLKEDSVFFDIGANFGFHSILSTNIIKKGNVFSFEPVPKTLDLLKKNISLNSLEGVIFPQNIALSSENKSSFITTNKFGRNHISKNGKNTTKIKMKTLDFFFSEKNLKKIDFIKCDVEGAEFLVLKGAEKTLRRFKPGLILEIQGQWTVRFGYSPEEIFHFLKKIGYSYHLLTEKGKEKGSNYSNIKKDLSKTNNFLFLAK